MGQENGDKGSEKSVVEFLKASSLAKICLWTRDDFVQTSDINSQTQLWKEVHKRLSLEKIEIFASRFV